MLKSSIIPASNAINGYAIGFCRVSTKSQAKDEFVSFSVQRMMIMGYLNTIGCKAKCIHEIVGSAWKDEKDLVVDTYEECVEEIEEKLKNENDSLKITHVVFPWIERGFRSTDCFMRFLLFCQRRSIHISFCRENIKSIFDEKFEVIQEIVDRAVLLVGRASIKSMKKSITGYKTMKNRNPDDVVKRVFGYKIKGDNQIVHVYDEELVVINFVHFMLTSLPGSSLKCAIPGFLLGNIPEGFDMILKKKVRLPMHLRECADVLNMLEVPSRKSLMYRIDSRSRWTSDSILQMLKNASMYNTSIRYRVIEVANEKRFKTGLRDFDSYEEQKWRKSTADRLAVSDEDDECMAVTTEMVDLDVEPDHSDHSIEELATDITRKMKIRKTK